MNNKDWMPSGHSKRHKLAIMIFAYLIGEVRIRAGLSEKTPLGDWYDNVYTPQCTTFCNAFDVWDNIITRTPAAFDNLKTAEKTFVPLIRKLYSGFLRENPLITDADLENMGLPKHSEGGRTPSPVATEAPDFEVDTALIAHLLIHFFEKGHRHRKAKPFGQHCVEFRWLLSDTVPTRWDELTNSDVDTNSPFTLAFENDQRGKTVYFALRWENTRGQKGPWTEIQSAIIP